MQKIDRDMLFDALESPYETSDIILQAAALLYEITAPDYNIPEKMLDKTSIEVPVKECEDIFRAMIGELVE
jgi:hypothetical protein